MRQMFVTAYTQPDKGALRRLTMKIRRVRGPRTSALHVPRASAAAAVSAGAGARGSRLSRGVMGRTSRAAHQQVRPN